MYEDKVLDQAVKLIDSDGMEMALGFLEANFEANASSQFYNYLYCIAALSGDHDKALAYLEEAIIDKKMWYRPIVFEDDDLEGIRNHERFKKCTLESQKSYEEALKYAKSVFTWQEKKENRLVIALHGNQQNIDYAKTEWSCFEKKAYQVEYLQSEELDSFGLYRWEDQGNGAENLVQVLDKVKKQQYEEIILGGFSAGCNTILRGIIETERVIDQIILQSPWLPIIDSQLDDVVAQVKKQGSKIYIICGLDDEDCIENSKTLFINF